MIWLIGNKGMLGTELSLLLERQKLPFTGTDRELDITDREALFSFAEKFQQNKTKSLALENIDWIINCAAYTAVDKAEDDSENCRLLNSEAAGNIAAVAGKTGAKLIHISTDYVFNGNGTRPYTEEDETDPIGVYGLTKRDGEIKVLEENDKSFIIRTAWLYGKCGNNFVHTMIRLMNNNDEVKVVDDQRGSPTWTYDLAATVLNFIDSVDSGKKIPFGIFHYTNEGDISWFDFAREILVQGKKHNCIRRDCVVTPCTSDDFPAKVKRPAYSVMDKSKIKAALEIEIPAWDASLKGFFHSYANPK